MGYSLKMPTARGERRDFLKSSKGNKGEIIGTATYTPTGPSDPIQPGSHGVLLMPSELAVDANRDGTIVLANDAGNPANLDANGNPLPVDVTTKDKPFTFWINDGLDGPSTISGESAVQDSLQVNSQSTSCANGQADLNSNAGLRLLTGTRDLENLARLWMYTKGLGKAITDGTITVGLEWHSNTGGSADGWGNNDGAPAINIYCAAPKHGASTNTGGADYLTDAQNDPTQDTAYDQVYGSNPNNNNIKYGYSIGTVAKGQPFFFPATIFKNLTDTNPETYFLFEGLARGTGRLVMTFNTGSAGSYKKIGEAPPVYLDLKDIKELYERWTVGDSNGGSPNKIASLSTARVSPGVTPLSYSASSPGLSVPGDPDSNKYIFYVHGWNLEPWEKDAFAETALKRLYWQGYKGKFGAFQWPTTYHSSSASLLSVFDYDDGEYSAWQSAVPLESKLAALNGQYPKNVYVIAHSMGNVVTGEALRIAGQSGAAKVVNTYVATQAAVPGHCYDPSLSGADLLNYQNGLLGPDTPNIYNGWMVPQASGSSFKVNFFNVNDTH